MAYSYLKNDIGERRSPIAMSDIVAHWAKMASPYYEGEQIQLYIMSDDEWLSDDYPGNWVDDNGHYQN